MKTLLKPLIVLLVITYAGWISFKWTVMRVYVPPNKALKVVNKYGQPLPPELIAVPTDHPEYKGVREELLGPGRYFLDPVRYDWELVPQVKISAGEPDKWQWDGQGRLRNVELAPKVGLVSQMQGKSAPPGQEVVGPEFK